jgi:phytoene dehydrogenase-like protein
VRFQKTPETCYFQVHSEEIPFSEGHSVFISLSHSEDNTRAPEGEQTLSASIHTHEKYWPHPRKSDEYKKQKKDLNKAFQKVINETFSDYGIEFLGRLEIGTPHTFERYTGRYKGRVGGLPHKRLTTLLSYPSSQTKLSNFYRLGDTVFPGQGVVGVISGAQKLIKLFIKRGEL